MINEKRSTTTPYLAVLTLALFCSGQLQAVEPGGTLAKIRENGAMVIGYRKNSPPFSFVDGQGNPSGYSIDLCKRIAAAVQKRLGIPEMVVTYVPVSVDDRIGAVESGKIDIECGATTNTLSRQERVDFTHITFVTGGTLLSLQSAPIRLTSEASGKRIAVVEGTTTESALRRYLSEALIKADIELVTEHAAGMGLLAEKKVDAFASDRLVLLGLVKNTGDASKFIVSDDFFSYEPYALMVRRNDADFRLVANRALSEVFRNEQIGILYRKWFGVIGARPSGLQMAVFHLQALPE
jgi:ABC-type amino acid transport substrate-binding protein